MVIAPGSYAANINGVKLAYHVIGEGPPLLVAAPGWGIGSSYLRRGWLPMSRHFSMIFLDPRGSGQSSWPLDAAAMGCQVMARDLHELRKILELHAVDVIAHSNGGAIAIELAALFPDHVSRLVLVDSQLMGFGAEEPVARFLASRP